MHGNDSRNVVMFILLATHHGSPPNNKWHPEVNHTFEFVENQGIS